MSFCCRVDIHRRDGLSTDTVSFLKLIKVNKKKKKEKGIEKWKIYIQYCDVTNCCRIWTYDHRNKRRQDLIVRHQCRYCMTSKHKISSITVSLLSLYNDWCMYFVKNFNLKVHLLILYLLSVSHHQR